MFTGIVGEMGTIEAISATPGGARLRLAARRDRAGVRGGRLGRDRRLLPHGRRGGRRRPRVRCRGRDPAADDARRPAGRRPGERRAAHADGRPSRRPLGAGPRRRGWAGDRGRRPTATASGSRSRPPRPCSATRSRRGRSCVAGVSLTVAAYDDDGFTVALIPHTRAVTTLGATRAGDPREPGGRPGRKVRREAGRWGGAGTIEAAVMTANTEFLEAYPDVDGSAFATVEEAIAEIRAGRMVVVVDSPDRENEGDLVIAAEHVTPEAINFMAKHARGLICLALERGPLRRARARPDDRRTTRRRSAPRSPSRSRHATGVSTGISAADRAHTIQVAIDPDDEAAATSCSRGTSSRCAPRRRRARADRPDRGLGRPGPARRAARPPA